MLFVLAVFVHGYAAVCHGLIFFPTTVVCFSFSDLTFLYVTLHDAGILLCFMQLSHWLLVTNARIWTFFLGCRRQLIIKNMVLTVSVLLIIRVPYYVHQDTMWSQENHFVTCHCMTTVAWDISKDTKTGSTNFPWILVCSNYFKGQMLRPAFFFMPFQGCFTMYVTCQW